MQWRPAAQAGQTSEGQSVSASKITTVQCLVLPRITSLRRSRRVIHSELSEAPRKTSLWESRNARSSSGVAVISCDAFSQAELCPNPTCWDLYRPARTKTKRRDRTGLDCSLGGGSAGAQYSPNFLRCERGIFEQCSDIGVHGLHGLLLRNTNCFGLPARSRTKRFFLLFAFSDTSCRIGAGAGVVAWWRDIHAAPKTLPGQTTRHRTIQS